MLECVGMWLLMSAKCVSHLLKAFPGVAGQVTLVGCRICYQENVPPKYYR